jgi:hypothetical protein
MCSFLEYQSIVAYNAFVHDFDEKTLMAGVSAVIAKKTVACQDILIRRMPVTGLQLRGPCPQPVFLQVAKSMLQIPREILLWVQGLVPAVCPIMLAGGARNWLGPVLALLTAMRHGMLLSCPLREELR